MAVSFDGDTDDYTRPPEPTVARISVSSCQLLGGENELPPLGRLSLNSDPKQRWRIELSAPQRNGPPNEGRRVVVGAGTTKNGLPWIVLYTSKRFSTLGAIDVYVRINEKWSNHWTMLTHLESFIATSIQDERSNSDIVAIEASFDGEKGPGKTYVHQWTLRQDGTKPLTVTDRRTPVDCVANPSEITAFDNRSILSLGRGADSQFVIERIDAIGKQVTRTSYPGLFDKDVPWSTYATSAESFVLWRVGLPAHLFRQEGNGYVGSVASSDNGRVARILAEYPDLVTFTVLPNGRPIALIVADNTWKLVSDEPVATPCKFPRHPTQ